MPKIVDRDRYREELLLNSFDLFATSGYANVTMRQIAGELDISTGTLYHYFQNKQTILQKMIEVIALQEIKRLLEIVYRTNNIEERVSVYLDYFKNREDFYKKLLMLLLDFKKFCVSKEHDTFLNNFANIIFNHVAEGVGVDKRFGTLAFILLSGMGYMLLIVPDVIDVDEQFELIKQIALDYLTRESALIKKPSSL
jgi:AcrR family transcriptional regulator